MFERSKYKLLKAELVEVADEADVDANATAILTYDFARSTRDSFHVGMGANHRAVMSWSHRESRLRTLFQA